MTETVALDPERLRMAELLLFDIERRHGLPHTHSRAIHPNIVDRFLVAYLPETHDGVPVPQAVEYAFTPSLTDAVELLRRTIADSDHGFGTACYIHDLNTGPE
ncbi:MAG TPA: hypothetical protein VFS40_05560 [Gemmatimonadales bacterium]|nr:hypothetical protein [Gemmatimonadales bacterium]